jgi:hypothetical protein
MASNEAKVIISADDKTKAGLTSAQKNIENLSKSAERLGTAIVEGFAVRQIFNFGKALFNAFSDSEASLNRFNIILGNIPEATDEVSRAFLQASAAVSKLGFDDEAAAESMASFYGRVKDTTTAIQLNTLAMEISRGSGKTFQESTQILTQVLNGQTKSVKALNIELADGVTPLQVVTKLQEKYGGALTKSMQTAKVATDRFSQSFTNFKEELGSAVARAFIPLLNALSSLFEWFGKLPTGVRVTIGVIVAATTAFAGLILVFATLQTALPLLTGAFVALKTAIFAMSGPVGWIIGAIGLLATGIVVAGNKLGWFKSEQDATGTSTTNLSANLEKLGISAINSSDGMKQLAVKTRDAKKEVEDLEKAIVSELIASGERQISLNQDIGTAVVEQEQKIRDLKGQIADEMDRDRDSRDMDRIDELRTQLETEQEALRNHKDLQKTYATEITEARRVAALTEFERTIERIKKEKEAEQKRLAEKIQEMWLELETKKAVLAELTKAEQQFTIDYKKEMDKQVEITKNAMSQIKDLRGSNKIGGVTTPAFRAAGGPVSMGGSYIVGEQGPELFTPNSSGSIIPNHRLAGTGGGVTINISGNTLLDGSAGDKLAAQIMRTLKQNLRI